MTAEETSLDGYIGNNAEFWRTPEWTCKTCGEQGTLGYSALHECEGPPLKICPKCHLTKPCECDE